MTSDAVSAAAAGGDGQTEENTISPLAPATSRASHGSDATAAQLVFNLVKGIVGA